jgi:signal transduction histidine kinase
MDASSMMKALRSAPSRLGGHLRRGAAAYGVLLIALLLTLIAFHYVRQNVEAQTHARFDETTHATQEAIERKTKAYLDAMFGARGLFYASEAVTPEEWDNYVSGIEPNERFEGLQALSYAERVDPDQREAFIERAQEEEGLPELRPDLNPGGERSAYFPLTYTGPLDEANQSMLNYDLYAEEVHREAMERARDTGSARATRMVYVLTEAPPSHVADLALRTGFVVYLPVYEEGEPQGTVAERRRALQGFIVGSFISDELLDGVFKGSFDPAIDFEVYDGGNVASSPLLYDSDSVKRAGEGGPEPLFSKESRIEVAGRQWSLYFATLPAFAEGAESNLPAFVLASGGAVSLLIFGITLLLVRSRTRAERASKDLEGANRELEAANRELEAFSYSVSHDLRAPLRSIEGFSQILLEDYSNTLEDEAKSYLVRLRAASRRMALLIDDLLELSRVTRTTLRRQRVNLSSLAREIADEIQKSDPEREVEFVISEGLIANADPRLLAIALENLLANAFKFTSREEGVATIEFGAIALEEISRAVEREQRVERVEREEGEPPPPTPTPTPPPPTPPPSSTTTERGEREGELLAYYVKDDGVGFEMAYAAKLFGPFQRLHGVDEFEGTGVGLATVARIVGRHGGRVWAVGEVGEGATFFFTLKQ